MPYWRQRRRARRAMFEVRGRGARDMVCPSKQRLDYSGLFLPVAPAPLRAAQAPMPRKRKGRDARHPSRTGAFAVRPSKRSRRGGESEEDSTQSLSLQFLLDRAARSLGSGCQIRKYARKYSREYSFFQVTPSAGAAHYMLVKTVAFRWRRARNLHRPTVGSLCLNCVAVRLWVASVGAPALASSAMGVPRCVPERWPPRIGAIRAPGSRSADGSTHYAADA